MFSLLSVLIAACSTPPQPTAHGVVIVYVDTLRADHMGFDGYDRPTSPRLDALATDAAIFDRAYAPSPWTFSSTASLVTGLYPATHGAILPGEIRNEVAAKGGVVHLAEPFDTIAEIAGAAGVRTALLARNRYIGFGVEQGFEHYANPKKSGAANQTSKALKWLDGIERDERFLMIVHYMDVHTPNRPPAAHRKPFPAVADMSVEEAREHAKFPKKYNKGAPRTKQGFAEAEAIRNGMYDASIHFVDAEVGRLIDRVREERGDNVTFIFTADHGEELWDHAELEKSLYTDPRNIWGVGHGHAFFDETLRVPLLVHDPGRIAPGRHDTPVSLIDVMPTVVELMELAHDGPVEGRSLLPVIAGDPGNPRAIVGDAVCFGTDKAALIDGNLKYVRSPVEPPLLVDLAADPTEQENLAPTKPELVARLDAKLLDQLRASRELGNRLRGDVEPKRIAPSDEELEALKALGYVWDDEDEGDSSR